MRQSSALVEGETARRRGKSRRLGNKSSVSLQRKRGTRGKGLGRREKVGKEEEVHGGGGRGWRQRGGIIIRQSGGRKERNPYSDPMMLAAPLKREEKERKGRGGRAKRARPCALPALLPVPLCPPLCHRATIILLAMIIIIIIT